MLSRFTAAGFGLFAFAVAVLAGVWVNNPFTVVLSRGLLALIVFFLIGLALGAAADAVVAEHSRTREAGIREQENLVQDHVDESTKIGAATIPAPHRSAA